MTPKKATITLTNNVKNSWDDIEDPEERERVKDFEEYGFALAEELKKPNNKHYRYG